MQGPPYDETDSDIKLFVPQYLKGTCLLNHNHLQINRQISSCDYQTHGRRNAAWNGWSKVKFLLGGFCEDHTGYEWVMLFLKGWCFIFRRSLYLKRNSLSGWYQMANVWWSTISILDTEATGTWLVLKPQNIQSQELSKWLIRKVVKKI